MVSWPFEREWDCQIAPPPLFRNINVLQTSILLRARLLFYSMSRKNYWENYISSLSSYRRSN